MYAWLKGQIISRNPGVLILELNGIAYELRISMNTYEQLPERGIVQVFCHLHIKEDSHTLYGFATEEEKTIFRELLKISGIGGNTALIILSGLKPAELRAAIDEENTGLLSKIKGIGSKTAARIILELKGKLPKPESTEQSVSSKKLREDAIAGLLVMGLSKTEAEKHVDAILKLNPQTTLSDLIKTVLRNR
ncbi:MAG: Holliday junction branch migration protein RuvA [Bacteroidia bacterium]|nr:Holliday junction branch migration protein RuvA [Bacteroidia bacterium]